MMSISSRLAKALAIQQEKNTVLRDGTRRRYKVRSQNGHGWYTVRKEKGMWRCECPDYRRRGGLCKHILSVNSAIIRPDRLTSRNFFVPQFEGDIQVRCPVCHSALIVKKGKRKNASGIVQRYGCKECSHRFVVNEGFLKLKSEGKIVAVALDLLFKGLSTRSVADTLAQLFNCRVSHSTIIRWYQRIIPTLVDFTDQLTPELCGILHIDEMMIHVRKDKTRMGHYAWLWNALDRDTRYQLASRISHSRTIAEARAALKDVKKRSKSRPIALVHDGLRSYQEANRKEFYTNHGPRTVDVRSVGATKDGLNQRIERLNGEFRDRERVTRGLDNIRSAQVFVEGLRLRHNFIKRHMALKGKTPAQAAGIDLRLEGIMWESLIRRAARMKLR